ncbi:streptophobe family protein [Streptomyces sp. NBC_01353]|uniref:streptophobe family protein n=1 Tax=Streptomyces sp. NBC_01353 TaxID=2903835 RepID=UPI002E336BB0|nr:streptophobe family protein [Streptomyces sp. NBC_01353]
MSAAPPPHSTSPVTPWRHALEGALSVATALVVMAATAWAALAVLGAGAIAPVSRLVPTAVGMAVGGGVTVESATSAETESEAEFADGGGLGGLLAGLGGGFDLGLSGEAAMTPLTLTFLGTAVLAIVFFRPLHRRPRPAPAMLWVRCGGALATAAVTLPVLAGMAHGTARLPESVTERFGDGPSSGAFGRFTSGGDGGAGDLVPGLFSVTFETDTAATVFFGLLWVAVVLAVGCVAARRTALPRPIALGRLRRKWNAVASTLTGLAAVLCCSALAAALVAGAAALTGRERAAETAGMLLLIGPNLIAALLSSGLGTSWEVGVHRLQSESGGLLGTIGAGPQGDAAGADRSVDLGGWSGAGVPVWLIALLLMLLLLVIAGYVAAARTPARTPREDSESLLGRHADIALRMGIAVGVSMLVLPLLARGSLRIGISVMDGELGGVAAGLEGSPGLSALAGCVLATLAAYGGSRLHGRRARGRNSAAGTPGTAFRRPAGSALARSASRVSSDSAT